MENARKTGILLDPDTGDLFLNKDTRLEIGNTLYQNQYLIMKSQPGAFKNNPRLGVGIDDLIGSNADNIYFKVKIRENLERDEMVVDVLKVKNGEIVLEADYE